MTSYSSADELMTLRSDLTEARRVADMRLGYAETLRDRLAMAALVVAAAEDAYSTAALAARAYGIADAMMAAREKR